MTPLDCPFCDRWLVFPATSFSTVWSPRIGKTGTQLATGCWIIRIFIWYREFWYHRGLLKKINEGLGRYDVFFPLWFAMTCLKDVLCADQITLECLRPVPLGSRLLWRYGILWEATCWQKSQGISTMKLGTKSEAGKGEQNQPRNNGMNPGIKRKITKGRKKWWSGTPMKRIQHVTFFSNKNHDSKISAENLRIDDISWMIIPSSEVTYPTKREV